MEKLKFPIFKGSLPAGKILSMDDYLKFVIFNLKYSFKGNKSRKADKTNIANIPFSFK